MGTQNKEIKIALNIQAKIDKANAQIGALKKQLDNFNLSKSLASGFAKEFKSIENEINELQRRTASDKINLIDANAASKEIDKIEKRWNFLLSKIGGDDFLSKGLKADAQAIGALENLMASYTKGIKEAEVQEGKLNKKLEKAKQHQQDLAVIQKTQKVVQKAEIEDQKAQIAILKTRAAEEKKIRDNTEAALRKRVADSGGTYTMDQVHEKGSPLRKTKEYRAFKDAQGSYDNTKQQIRTAETNVDSMVTKEMQVAEAKAAQDAIDQAAAALENFQKNQLAVAKTDAFKKAKDSLKEIAEFKDIDWSGLNIDFSQINNIEDLENSLAQLRIEAEGRTAEALKALEHVMQETAGGFSGMGSDIQSAKESLEEFNESSQQAQNFETKIKQFLGMAGAAQVFRVAMRNAIDTIKELDKTMGEMAVVTDLGVGDYWDQLPEYTARAKQLGLAINDVYKADTLFYQQGLKVNEVVEISTQTMKMARIAGLDTAEATDRMTAALRGFNMELNELSAQKVADVYSELAAITAADVEEISSAMTKTASIASSAGMEFETTAAFLSQIIETTRESAETAGTAMKTVIARFQELKKSPDEIGEIDGEIVDANAIETALRSVGVSLRDAGGQFRDLDDVFLELSSKWNTLDKNTQRYIATIAAGSRQQSRFIAMMSDYSRTQELVTAANTSAGASARQYEKTLDTLETKLAKLQATWQEFTMGIMDSDLVKMGVDILTKFLEIVNKVTQGIDGFGSGLSKVMSILTIFKMGMKIFEKFKQPMINFFVEVAKQAGLSGEASAKAYQEGLQKGVSKTSTKQKIVQSIGGQTIDKTDPNLAASEKQVISAVGKQGGFVNRTFNTAMKVTGADHIAKGMAIFKENKQDQAIVGKNAEERVVKAQAYEANKKALEEKKNQYTFDKEGKITGKKASGKNKSKMSKDDKKKAEEEIGNLTKEVEDYENAQDRLQKNSGKAWEAIGDGISTASTALMGVGMGLGAVSSALESAGLDEAAEGFAKVGSVMTTTGAILGIFPPLLSLIQTLFPGVGAAGSAAGATTGAAGLFASGAWSVVGIIVLAVIAAILVALAVILIVMAVIKNNSPEKKLAKLQEGADAAANAADQAAESYENLANSLDGLDGKYKALEDLTRGTEEWNKAVEEINNSVLDLIAEYPELAAFVENKEGVLTIDVESDGVQAVLSEKQASVAAARNAAIGMQMEVTRAEAAVELKDIVGQSDTNAYEDELKALGEAIANGTVQQDKASMQTFLEEQGVGDAAQRLAQSFADNADKVKEFGKNLQQANKQLEAQYEAMATQAEMTADTTGWSEEEIMQGQNLVTGDIYKKFEEEAKKKAKKVFATEDNDKSGLNSLDAEQERLLTAAIKQIYGEEAKRNGKKVTYVNENNETVTENLAKRQDQIVNAMTQISATEQTKAAMEGSKSAIATINKQFGSDIASKVYSKDGGGALSEADAKAISEKNLDAIWNKLNDNEKAAFANDKSIFKNKFKESADAASVAIGDVRNSLEELGIDSETVYKIIDENINKDVAVAMKGNFTKLAEMLKLQGKNATDISKTVGNIATQYKDILSKVPEELQSSLAGAFASIDASSIESLNHFKWELINVYGIEENAAIALTDALKEAGIATSSFELEVEVFGKLQEALEETTKLLDKFTDLQWEYNEALRNGTTQDILNMGKEQVSNLVAQVGGYKTAYEEAQKNIATVYASGATYDDNINQDYRRYVTLSKNGEYEVDQAKVQEDLEGGNLNGETFNEWLEKLSEQAENMEEVEEAAKEAYDSLVELEQQTKDAYYQLRELAENAVIDKLQEQINIQEQTLDATQRANDQMISKIQESIDDSRQARENAKVEESIEKMYSKQAYLASETSGANQLESQQLAKAIAEAEQSYQDSLIDQTLQNLQDANEKAAEQRERQITLAQEQLDAYQNSIEFQSHIEDLMSEAMSADSITNTRLGDLLREQQTAGMTAMEKADWAQQLNALNAQAKIYSETEWVDLQKEAYNDITTIADTINAQQEALVKKTTNQADQLKRKGFNVLDYNTYASSAGSGYGGGEGASMSDYEGYLDRMTTWSNEPGNTDTVSATSKYSSMVSDKYTYLDDNGKEQSIMSQQEYNASVASRVAAGEKNVPTYSEYIDKHYQDQYNFMLSGANFRSGTDGWFPIYFSGLNDFQEGSNGGELDAVIGKKGLGTNPVDYYVGLGPSATGNKAQVIKEVMKKTYNPKSANWPFGLDDVTADTPTGYAQGILYDGKAYIYYNGNIRELMYEQEGKNQANVMNTDASSSKQYIKQFPKKGFKFKTGGIADFTGPAWLDGTPSKPEYVLNSAQTERFFSLIDVLEKYDTEDSKKVSGDNYFDIEINVEKLENDYDVEKLADKIRNMIYNDATYRNVNAINHIR